MSRKFDRYSTSYEDAVRRSIGFVGQDVDFFTENKADHLVEIARRSVGDPANLRALDVGCGVGLTDRLLAGRFGALEGVDVSEEAVDRARRENPDVTYRSYDGDDLPYADAEFDVAFAICVMHHVPPERWEAFSHELARVVRPGGITVVFEHNPLNPLTRLAVARCEFDDDAVLLTMRRSRDLLRRAALREVESAYILFFPWRGATFRRGERRLRRVPLGAQYYVAGRRDGAA